MFIEEWFHRVSKTERGTYKAYKDRFKCLSMLEIMDLPLGVLTLQGSYDGTRSHSYGQMIRAKWGDERGGTIWVVDGNHQIGEMLNDPEVQKEDPLIVVIKVPHFDWELKE